MSATDVATLLERHRIHLESTAPGRYHTTCPRCSKDRKSHHQKSKCLGVTIKADGGVHFGCNHCGWTGPEKGSGGNGPEREARPLTAYRYGDRLRKVRNPKRQGPKYFWQHLNGQGQWKAGTGGIPTKDLLYRIDEVEEAIAAGETIAAVEGEKDADALWKIGIAATCNAHGASKPGKKPKWTEAHSRQLAGADLVVFNDNDAPGYAHADAVCRLSHGTAKRLRRLDLKDHWPEIPEGGDVSDWLAVGGDHTAERLETLIAAAPDWEAADAAEAAAGEAASGEAPLDNDQELERLARMPVLDYAQARKDAAKRLGITKVSFLDTAVKVKRAELGLNAKDDGKQGRAIELPEPTPWETPVNGAELLNAVSAAIRRYVVMPDYACDAIALWNAHTYLLDWLMITPRLAITSPTRGCGKTTLLDVEGQLVFRPLAAANCSPSSVFRVVEGFRPCLLIDEADSFLSNNEELRGVLNSGHRRGGSVLRNVGDEHEPRSFSTFAACAIALIGRLPGTLADRAVPINLVRRKADEVIEPFRFDRVDHLVVLARKLMRWSKDNADAIAATEPEIPAGLYNRTADNWRGLLAIATVAGGDWLARGHKAALQSVGADIDEGSRLELLLGDVRDILDEHGLDRIAGATLINRLCEITPRPWAEFGRSGKEITPNKLARLLKPLGISPVLMRIGTEERARGYARHQFEEAFARYLASEGVSNRDGVTNADETGTSALFQSVTARNDVTVPKSEKSNIHGPCHGVTVEKGGTGHKEGTGPSATDEDGGESSPSTRWPGLGPRAVDQFAREVSGLKTGSAAGLEDAIRTRLAKSGVPVEALDVEVENVVRRIMALGDVDDTNVPTPAGRATEPAPYEVLGEGPPGERCVRCGKSGGVKRIRYRGCVDLWHAACLNRHLAATRCDSGLGRVHRIRHGGRDYFLHLTCADRFLKKEQTGWHCPLRLSGKADAHPDATFRHAHRSTAEGHHHARCGRAQRLPCSRGQAAPDLPAMPTPSCCSAGQPRCEDKTPSKIDHGAARSARKAPKAPPDTRRRPMSRRISMPKISERASHLQRVPLAPDPSFTSAPDGMGRARELARCYLPDLVQLLAAIALAPGSEAALHTRMLSAKALVDIAGVIRKRHRRYRSLRLVTAAITHERQRSGRSVCGAASARVSARRMDRTDKARRDADKIP